MKNILVPVGTSTNARSHLKYAVDFAKDFGAKIYLVQIYNVYTKAGTFIKVDDIIIRKSMEFLNGHVASVDTRGVDIEVKTFKGDVVDIMESICDVLAIDLIILEPRTNSIKDEVYLGKDSGRIIKRTQIPALIVPEGFVFKPMISILVALKTAVVRKEGVFKPLKEIKEQFNSVVNLLLVKTPIFKTGDFDLPEALEQLITKQDETVNPTTFQGVLERYQSYDPDLLCVVRRKRGFFSKLWEGDAVLKKDFYARSMPVLVLRGLK